MLHKIKFGGDFPKISPPGRELPRGIQRPIFMTRLFSGGFPPHNLFLNLLRCRSAHLFHPMPRDFYIKAFHLKSFQHFPKMEIS